MEKEDVLARIYGGNERGIVRLEVKLDNDMLLSITLTSALFLVEECVQDSQERGGGDCGGEDMG